MLYAEDSRVLQAVWKCYGQPELRTSTRSADLFLPNEEMCALTCSRPDTTTSIETSRSHGST